MDDDEWQEMPVVRGDGGESSASDSSASEAKEVTGARSRPKKRGNPRQYTVAQEYKRGGIVPSSVSTFASSTSPTKNRAGATGNATGKQLDIQDARGFNWRAKPAGLDGGFGSSPKGGEKKDRKEKARAPKKRDKDDISSSSSSSSADSEDEENSGDAAKGYTQLRLDDDPEIENLNAATDYLFTGSAGTRDPDNDDLGATPQSQLHTTKNLLSEGQKIAYVGLVSLTAKGMVRAMERVPGKEYKPAIASADDWRLRVMARLYQHMDIDAGEQSMIDSLAQHGVLAQDLAPSLIVTQTVDNPDYDPEAAAEREEERERERQEQEEKEQRLELERQRQMQETAAQLDTEREEQAMDEAIEARNRKEYENDTAGRKRDTHDGVKDKTSEMNESAEEVVATSRTSIAFEEKDASRESEGIEGDLSSRAQDGEELPPYTVTAETAHASFPPTFEEGEEESRRCGGENGDLGQALDTPKTKVDEGKSVETKAEKESVEQSRAVLDPNTAAQVEPDQDRKVTSLGLTNQPQMIETLPSALEGVTEELSSADKTITLDLRWTVLCDLFLVLTADSVYDARSRVLLESIAEDLGLTWMDVTKFEKRVTDALEIEEGVAGSLKGKKALRKRAEMARKRRMIMMGLATVGGGLVIGLSAGVMAPVIGLGLGAAFGSVGIGGTTALFTGAGGITLITGTGAIGGAALAGTGMSKRTRQVKTFEFKPIHNNKRVNCILAVPGFMNNENDDPRLPFSVLDSIVGDIFSLLWEPDMMAEMGNAIQLLWNETIVQGVQQVLAATIATGLVGALAFPLWLTKLGYFIDNPWSNALDRAHACGLILADVLGKRKMGVRPITLVGYSLGARVIFYALVELARTQKFGIVQNVYVIGAPVIANDKTWQAARSVVAGRFVNAFSRSDWILGYLFRATSGGLGSIAGLRPVERVPDVENVDVTQTVPGHLQYRSFMPLVLDQLGFKTTADYFDEPEDLAAIPEREIVYDDSEMQLKTVKTKTGGFGKIFRKTSADPNRKDESGSGTSAEVSRRGSVADNEDDLPPREEAPHSPLPQPHTVPRDSEEKVPMSPAVSTQGSTKSLPLSADEEMAQILAELRESGIEVKELQSSLPPLVASKSAQPSSQTTHAASSSLKNEVRPLSLEQDRPQTPEAQAIEYKISDVEETPRPLRNDSRDDDYFGDKRPARFIETSFKDLPSSAPPVNAAADVALSFGDSYEGDNLSQGPTSSSRPSDVPMGKTASDFGDAERRYGISQNAARDLAMQFESSGMSSGGALAAAKLAQNLEKLDGADMSIASSSAAAANHDDGKLQPPESFASMYQNSGWGASDPWTALSSSVQNDLTPMATAARKMSSGGSDGGLGVPSDGGRLASRHSNSSPSHPHVALPQSTHSWETDNPWG